MSNSDKRDLLPVIREAARQGLLQPGERVVVAVSGGADSVALLDLLHRLSHEVDLGLHVAHLNHQLRGTESDADAEFVSKVASDRGLSITIESCDVAALAKEKKKSLEDAARGARLTFLEHVRQEQGAGKIALGHHLNDQAETVLLRLLRGSGRTGLSAMRPVRDGIIIRPLLEVPKADIEAYVDSRGMSPRVDQTNGDKRFLRNRVRHELLPQLTSYNPDIVSTLGRSATLLQDEDDYLERIAREGAEKALLHRDSRKIVLAGSVLSDYHISITRRMLRLMLGTEFPDLRWADFSSVKKLVSLLQRGSGSVQISADVAAHLSNNRLIVHRKPTPFQVPLRVPGQATVSALGLTVETRVRPAEEVRGRLTSLGSQRACFDLDDLEGEELVLRSRSPGDRFRPFGASGSRKISEFLIDEKVPRPLRDDVPLLVCGNTVLWVVGLRTAQPRSVSKETRQVLDAQVTGEAQAWNL